jgi:hypothetical protein
LVLRISTRRYSLWNRELLCGLWCLLVWRMHHLPTNRRLVQLSTNTLTFLWNYFWMISMYSTIWTLIWQNSIYALTNAERLVSALTPKNACSWFF